MFGASKPIKFKTKLSCEECRTRLVLKVDRLSWGFTRTASGPQKMVIGKFAENRFRLSVRQFSRNSFIPFFYGRFIPSEEGALIEGRFQMHPFVIAFVSIWFLGLILFFLGQCALLLGVFRLALRNLPPPALIIVNLALMSFGWGLVTVGKRMGQPDKEVIIRFLAQTLSACPASDNLERGAKLHS